MNRRTFLRTSINAGAGISLCANAVPGSAEASTTSPCPPPFPQVTGVTKYVADFVFRTHLADIPAGVIDLGKKSLLDGIGLALAGSMLQTADILHRYMQSLEFGKNAATVMGKSNKLPPRFAAFVNGVAIHVEDFDDTQLSAGKDRVYGLLTHPTVPVLPAAFAVAQIGN